MFHVIGAPWFWSNNASYHRSTFISSNPLLYQRSTLIFIKSYVISTEHPDLIICCFISSEHHGFDRMMLHIIGAPWFWSNDASYHRSTLLFIQSSVISTEHPESIVTTNLSTEHPDLQSIICRFSEAPWFNHMLFHIIGAPRFSSNLLSCRRSTLI